MSVISDLVDGIVQVTDSTGEALETKIRAILIGVSLVLVLLFLLILFFVEPFSATLLALAGIGVIAYLRHDGSLG